MTFVRAPGYATPTEVWAWLLEQGCRPLNSRVFFDGYEWRGSGRVEPVNERGLSWT